MRHAAVNTQPWAVASVVAAITVAAVAGTVAELTRRKINQIATLDPRAPFDPYYGMAEYTFNADPA